MGKTIALSELPEPKGGRVTDNVVTIDGVDYTIRALSGAQVNYLKAETAKYRKSVAELEDEQLVQGFEVMFYCRLGLVRVDGKRVPTEGKQVLDCEIEVAEAGAVGALPFLHSRELANRVASLTFIGDETEADFSTPSPSTDGYSAEAGESQDATAVKS